MKVIHSMFYATVLPNSAVGALFILFILAFRKMTERLSKGYVRLLWIFLLVELLAPPLLHSSLYTMRNLAIHAPIAQSRTELQTEAGDGAGVSALKHHIRKPDTGDRSAGVQELSGMSPHTAEVSFVKTWSETIKAVIPVLWLSGAFILCAVFFGQFLALRKKTAGAVYLPEEGCWAAAQVDMAFVMPYIRPRIYLPQRISGSGRADVLAHERQHIKNFDPFLKCLAAFAMAVQWFNPLVWAAYLCMGKDLEMYCDECVMRGKSIDERKRYSRTLLESASGSNGLTLITRFGESNTERRIRHVLYAKKPRFAVAFFLAALVGASGVCFLTAKNVEGKRGADADGQYAKEQLAEKILARSSGPLLKNWFADFDGDGEKEMFAVTGAWASEGTSQIWFASPEETTCLMDDGEGYSALWQDEECVYTVNSSQKLFLVTCGTMGDSFFSKCYYVADKKAREVVVGAYLEQIAGEDFAVYSDAYDRVYIDGSWSGHTRKAYYLKWMGDGFEEYAAKEITVDAFEGYNGAGDILEQIKESGYEVRSIYLRDNGLLHINIAQAFDTGWNYENVTLQPQGGRMYVVGTDFSQNAPDGRDLLQASSFGGIYKASGFLLPSESNAGGGTASAWQGDIQSGTGSARQGEEAHLGTSSARQGEEAHLGTSNARQGEEAQAGARRGKNQEEEVQGQPDVRGYYEELIAAAAECAIKNNGEKPEGYDFSSMLYMKKDWDYGTLGYLIKDIDGDGIEELIFGGNAEASTAWYDGIIYDIYTVSNGKLVHVLDGWERSRYFLCEDGTIANEGSDSAFDGGKSYYTFQGAQLQLVESVIWTYEKGASVYYYTTTSAYDTENAEKISQGQFDAITGKYVYEHMKFIPFAKTR